jgi:hypothetical protein
VLRDGTQHRHGHRSKKDGRIIIERMTTCHSILHAPEKNEMVGRGDSLPHSTTSPQFLVSGVALKDLFLLIIEKLITRLIVRAQRWLRDSDVFVSINIFKPPPNDMSP